MDNNTLLHNLQIKCLFFLVAASTVFGQVIYVDSDAVGNNDGSSWSNAYKYLQDALADANSSPKPVEIRVAQGVYKPDANSADPNGSGDRYAAFELINGVAIKGGYAGFGEPDPNSRNVDVYGTILSGDLNADDEPNFVNNAENSYNVIYISRSEGSAFIDGFTITSGNANGSNPFTSGGGGLFNYGGGRLLMTNCTLRNNYALYGGGVSIRYGKEEQTKIISCLFSQNKAHYGGGALELYNSSPTIVDCRFIQNSGAGGGAIYCYNFIAWPEEKYCNPKIINSEFIDNKSTDYGGAIYFRGECQSILTNCAFRKNSAGHDGGAIYEIPFFQNCYTTLLNCTVAGNTANDKGGGVVGYGWSQFSLTNCILWGNKDVSGINERSQIQIVEGFIEDVSIKFSCIQDDNPNDTYIPFGGLPNHNTDDNPNFVRVLNNGGDGWDVGKNDNFDNVRLSFKSPCVDTGDNTSVPLDATDIDNDANITEPIPWDLDSHHRFADGDCNGTIIVDMGAYEFAQGDIGNLDCNGFVDFKDFSLFASAWLSRSGDGRWNPDCDISIRSERFVDVLDLVVLMENWLEPLPPGKATNPNPSDGAKNVALLPTLKWSGGSYVASHAVYFGTSYPPAFRGNQEQPSCNIGPLSQETNYYWRIDEINSRDVSIGAVWTFQTGRRPGQASNPNPADRAKDVNIAPVLSWTAGSGATSHDVYFGITLPLTFLGNQTDTTFSPGMLYPYTIYNWRIDEVNDVGTSVGKIWSFQTRLLPEQASNPNPPDGAEGISINPVLSWAAGSGATSHNVYFGSAFPLTFYGNQTDTTFHLHRLSLDVTFYWRIDEVNESDIVEGAVWSFTTAGP